MVRMTTLIRDTGEERLYWFQEKDQYIDGVRYVYVRTYTLTDRWKRTGDQWFRIDEPGVEEPYWEISFDYRPEKVSP